MYGVRVENVYINKSYFMGHPDLHMTNKYLFPARLKRLLVAGIGILKGMFFYPIAWFWTGHPRDPVALAVADMLMIGFFGSKKSSPSARLLARQIRNGQVNGVFFVKENIANPLDLKPLLELFGVPDSRLLVAVDHEGGAVQRLSQRHGMTRLPRARQVGLSQAGYTQARGLYAMAGRELSSWGFNLNLGPVVDVHDPENKVIGAYGRSYGRDSHVISTYAAAFVDGFGSNGIMCALKHFPGHGCSLGDSHYQTADISTTWSEAELEPYKQLIALKKVPMVMTGHLRLDKYEPSGSPVTFSRSIVKGILRERLGYSGVVLTDDLDMDAVRATHNRRQAIIGALKAGNDLLMIKNLVRYDPLLPKRALLWIRKAIKSGELQEQEIIAAANRIRSLKAYFAGISALEVTV